MKRLVGFSLGGLQHKYGDKEALTIAKRIGADAVDFATEFSYNDYKKPDSLYSKSDEEIIAYYKDIKAHADSLGLVISQTHGRMEGFRNNKELDHDLIENARRDLLACSVLGAKYCVIHAVTSIFMGPDADPDLMHDLNFEMFNTLIPYAKEYGVIIATETFGDAVRFNACDFFGNIDEFIKSYKRISEYGDNKDYFTICVDTGHSNKASRYNNNPSPADVIRMLGSDISVLHLNDNDKMTDQHKIPLTGNIDWNDVLKALDEVGYNGVYNMELALGSIGGKGLEIESAEYGIKVMRNLLKLHYGEDA